MANIFPFFDARRQISKRLSFEDLSDGEMIQTTRFPRSIVEELRDVIGGELNRHTGRSSPVPVETQLLAALEFYATGSFQWVVGRNCGLAQSSVSHCISKVTEALVKLAPEYIVYPTDAATLRATKHAFHQVARFPNVVGAIDCTHVVIKAPTVNEEAYVNRKGAHTINVQAVCDADMKLLDVVAKWPGSSHDSFIWRSSGLRDAFSSGLLQGGWLLGNYKLAFSYLVYLLFLNSYQAYL